MPKTSQRIDFLKDQREKLNAKIKKLEAAEKHAEKKRDTRRKILIGAYYWDKAKEDNTVSDLVNRLDSYLTRDSDRELFDLPPRSSEKNSNTSKS